ncbi:LEA type 2 family protein [Candidatus Colwellia aromaticivorans]|uniref:LEA type 2 family protein n=1 Tax=Candidatus Colwellia aromaticivorans TaxID=2267621 RepID=UPI000DF26F71|nr:LEA type 2 family protein [Candidatus Colwellia aromaticivorans]
MTIARALPICFFYVAALFILSSCATLTPDYEEPIVELVSFKTLPANGFEQNFEIGLKLTNPNNFALPLNGISYQLSVAGETLAHGVATNIPTAGAYGESRFMVPISTSLLGGIKVIRALMDTQGQDISYQLKAKLDIDIPFVPKLTVIENGIIPLGQKPLKH